MDDQSTVVSHTREEPISLRILRALSSLDWRTWFGLFLTFSWLLLGYTYIGRTVGWTEFASLPADQLGNFLEGAFAPLAFLWLVIGYFIQQSELQQNTRALQSQLREIERTAEQSVIQSQQMAASEVHARQETFLNIVQNVRSQLGTIAAFLFISSQSAAADGDVSPEEQSALFSQMGRDDPEVFSRRLLETHIMVTSEDEQFRLFYGTPVRARHTNNFIFTFERLLGRAAEVDTQEIIRDSLYGSGHGLLYQIAKRHQQAAPAELADHSRTGMHLQV